MEKNRVTGTSNSRKSQTKLSYLRASTCEIISPKCLQTTSKCRFEFFRPIGRNANAKFKGAPNFSGEEFQNSLHTILRIVAL